MLPILMTKKQYDKLYGYKSTGGIYVNIGKIFRDKSNLIKIELNAIRYDKYAKPKFKTKPKAKITDEDFNK